MYPICSMGNVDFRELVDEHILTYGEAMLDFVDFGRRDPPHSVRSCREEVNFHYAVLTLEEMADAADLCK